MISKLKVPLAHYFNFIKYYFKLRPNMTPSLSAFLSSIFLAVIVVLVPISAALVFVSTSDKIIRS